MPPPFAILGCPVQNVVGDFVYKICRIWFATAFFLDNSHKHKGCHSPDHLQGPQSTPNMTGRRFHRTMEMIPALPWSSKSPSVSTPIKQKVQNKATQEVRARYDAELHPFVSIVQCPGHPVILGMGLSPDSPKVAFQTQTQNRSVLATQLPKSHPCPRW